MRKQLLIGSLLLLFSFTNTVAQETQETKPFARVVFEIDLPQNSGDSSVRMIILLAVLDPYTLDTPGDYTICNKKVGKYEYTVRIRKMSTADEFNFLIVQKIKDGLFPSQTTQNGDVP